MWALRVLQWANENIQNKTVLANENIQNKTVLANVECSQ